MAVAFTQLIPIQEMAPGSVAAIRLQVTNALVALAARELNMTPDQLVVRDLRPVEDLQLYGSGTTAATIDDWIFTTAATTATGFVTISGDKTMGDQRYVALYGVRELRFTELLRSSVTVQTLVWLPDAVSLLKINVGGGDKVIWDTTKIQCYPDAPVAITPGAVVIPQNASFNISIYKAQGVASAIVRMILEGVVVEPRGKVISP